MHLINSLFSFLSDTITFLVFFGIFYILYHSLYQHYILRKNGENNKYVNSSLELEKLKEPILQTVVQTFDIKKQIDESISFENIDSQNEETLNHTLIITNNNESLPLVLEDVTNQQSGKSSSFPKLALAGASTLIGVLVAGLLMSQGLNGTSKLQKFQQQTISINNLNKIKGTPLQSSATSTTPPKTVKRVVVQKVPTQTKTVCLPKSHKIPHRL